MLYLIIALFFFANMVCFDWIGFQRNKMLLYYIELIILVLVAGLRYKVGGDTFYYMEFWKIYPTLENFSSRFLEGTNFNLLWVITTVICKTICSDFVFFQIVQALFVNAVFFWFFKKYTPYIFTAVFCYTIGNFLYFNTEILREIVCVCLFMLATPALLKKQYLQYYLLCLVAFGFHTSAVIMFVAPFLQAFKKIDLRWAIILSVVVLVGSSLFSSLASNLVQSLSNPLVTEKYDYYVDASEYSIAGILYQFFLCIPVAVLLFFNQKEESENAKFNNLVAMLIFLYVFALFFYDIALRFCNYFIPFYIVFGCNIFIKQFKNNDLQFKRLPSFAVKPLIIASVFFIFFNFGYYYFQVYSVNYSRPFYERYYPYTSVFTTERDHKIVQDRYLFIRSVQLHKTEIDLDEPDIPLE